MLVLAIILVVTTIKHRVTILSHTTMLACNCGNFFPSLGSLAQHHRRHPEHKPVVDNDESIHRETLVVAESSCHPEQAVAIPLFTGQALRGDDSFTDYPNANPPEDKSSNLFPCVLGPTNQLSDSSTRSSLSSDSSKLPPVACIAPDSFLVDKYDKYATSRYGHMPSSAEYETLNGEKR